MVFVVKSIHHGNGNENVAIKFSCAGRSYYCCSIVSRLFVDLVVLLFYVICNPTSVENRGTMICISALKSNTTS